MKFYSYMLIDTHTKLFFDKIQELISVIFSLQGKKKKAVKRGSATNPTSHMHFVWYITLCVK